MRRNRPFEDIARHIQDMGYILATPTRPPTPSYYKLGDSTILSVLISINHILMDKPESGAGSINHSMNIQVFVPRRYKMDKPVQPGRQPNIIEQDVKCTPLKEEFNEYAVGPDIIIGVKPAIAQVVKTDAYSNAGEPIYNINVQPVIKVVDKRQQAFASDMR